ncbi:hypothetical protein K2173_011796 [Erythroxylum novogranatense]|uniref:Uncharacterized protein n=1 Tax=Erythroxylum novogranatense TaxID=1862640 RepID=A0AAV8S5M3_9ROSI|nr:hypothetical protein K2173_011796 [Erythroxylum novogranatense]
MARGQVWRKNMETLTKTGTPTLTRQPSATKNTCLCSSTNHAGSFGVGFTGALNLQRTKSIDSEVRLDTNSRTDGGVAANVNAVEGH